MKSIASQSFYEIAGKLFRFLSIILVARYLGVNGFGRFALVVTFIEVLNVIADFKVDPGMVRKVTKKEISEKAAFGNALSIKISVGIITVLVSFPLFSLITSDVARSIDFAFAVSSLFFYQVSSITKPIFQLYGILEKFTMARAVSGLFLLVSYCILMIFAHGTVRNFLIIYALSFFLEAIIVLEMCGDLIPIRPLMDIGVVTQMMKEGLFFSIMNIFVVFYYKIDTLLMEVFKGSEVLGIYNAAYRLIDVSMFIPMAVGAVFYPDMLKRVRNEPAGWSSGQKALELLLGLSVPLTMLFYFASDSVVMLTYGYRFIRTASILGILSFAMIFLYPATIVCQALIVAGRDKILMAIHASAAVASILIYCFAIERFGPEGAAWATVLLQASVFLSACLALRHEDADINFSCLLRILFFSIPIILAGWLMRGSDINHLTRLTMLAFSSVPVFSWLLVTTVKGWKDALS